MKAICHLECPNAIGDDELASKRMSETHFYLWFHQQESSPLVLDEEANLTDTPISYTESLLGLSRSSDQIYLNVYYVHKA